MKLKKIMAMVLCVAMVLSMMGTVTFAEETGDTSVDGDVIDGKVTITNTVGFSTFTVHEGGLEEALSEAAEMTGDVTVEIYDKVTLNQSLTGSYSSIKFVGKDTDAEIYLDVQGYITASGKDVSFENLKLSKSAGEFITNAGFMNVAFGVYQAKSVNCTDCTFTNGAYASSGENTFTNCTFYRSHDKYGLWAYGDVEVVVDGCSFADYRGIKMYAEGAAKTVDLTVKNTDFSAVSDKPAIVLTYGESVTLEGNTYSSTGVFELDLDGAPDGTSVTSDVEPTCKNDNGACGVIVDGMIYTTVAQAAAVATEGSTVTLLHDSTETVEFAEGVILEKNGFEATGVTVKTTIVAAVTDAEGNVEIYNDIQAAINAAQEGDTVTICAGVYSGFNISNKNITIQGTVGDDGELLTTIKGGNPAITGHSFNGTIKDIKIVDAWRVMYAEPAGNVTVDNVYVTGATYGFHLIAYSTGLTWTIKNSYMDLRWANSFGVYGDGYADIIIKGNEFISTDPYYPDYGAIHVNSFLPSVTVEENIFRENARIYIDGSVTDTSKIKVSKNYHADGVENAFADDSDGVQVEIDSYYKAVDENGSLTELVIVPKGSINGGLVNLEDANRTFLTIESYLTYANESVVVKVYDENDTLLVTSSLVDNDRVILGKENWGGLSTFVGINCTDEWWDVEWEEGKLSADYIPAKATLFVDGVEMNTAAVQMRAAGTETEVVWAEVPGVPKTPVAKIGDAYYTSLKEAADAAASGDTITLIADATLTEDITLPADIIFDGNGKNITGNIFASGNMTFAGHTKVTNFNAGYNKPVITIGEGACLELTGSGRMVIGHGTTFNITGSIADAKTADTTNITPSLIAAGASFTGAGVNFNVTDAYIKFTAYCSSKNSAANGTFNINATNSVWEQSGSLVFSQPTSGMDPTFNFNLRDSVLNSTSHLVFAVTKGEIVIDNSYVNKDAAKQLENRSNLIIKNNSVVYANDATSSNAKKSGTLTVDNAKYIGTGEYSGSDLGIGTLILKNNADVTLGTISKTNVTIDGTSLLTATKIADVDTTTITVDVASMSAGTIKKVVDLNGNASIESIVTVTEGADVTYGDDGDVTVAKTAINPFKDSPLFLAGLPDETVDGVTYHPVYMATSIDSLNYQKVGFDYIFSIFDPETGEVTFKAPYTTETKEVYSSISDANTTYTVESIGGNGMYLFMNKVLFNTEYYHNNNTKVSITPYAIDMNGNKITGWTLDMTNEYYKSLQSGDVKVDMFKEGN